jgi:hypothetical protein
MSSPKKNKAREELKESLQELLQEVKNMCLTLEKECAKIEHTGERESDSGKG